MANITNKPIQNIWASKTTNIEPSSNADTQGILYGADIVSNQLNGALNTLSNQVAFNQYNGTQYSDELTYNVGNVVSVYYRKSNGMNYSQALFKCINDNGGNGVKGVAPINNGTTNNENGITYITGGSINTTNWQALQVPSNAYTYHSSNQFKITPAALYPNMNFFMEAYGVNNFALHQAYAFSMPLQNPLGNAIAVITEQVRFKWVNSNLAKMFSNANFTNFNQPNIPFNQSTTDSHDYIATIKLHYDTNGKLVKYHLKFEDFNSNVSDTTIPVMLMCGVRSGVALYDCGNTLPNNSNPNAQTQQYNTYDYNIFTILTPYANCTLFDSLEITLLNQNSILQFNNQHLKDFNAIANPTQTSANVSYAVNPQLSQPDNKSSPYKPSPQQNSSLAININIDPSKAYKIGHNLGTDTIAKMGEFKYTSQPCFEQEDGWYDLAILTEIEMTLFNGGTYNVTGINAQTLNTNSPNVPFNPINNMTQIFRYLFLPNYLLNSILTDTSNIFNNFQSLSNEGLRSIGLVSVNNYLNPSNITKINQSITENFEILRPNVEQPSYSPVNFKGTTNYGYLNNVKIALGHTNQGWSMIGWGSNSGSTFGGNIGGPTFANINFFLADTNNETNSSFSAPASIYCSLAIRVG
ncbi:hypothetical protein COL5_15300 [Helicobacter pylori]